jgi:hypothetical protein
LTVFRFGEVVYARSDSVSARVLDEFLVDAHALARDGLRRFDDDGPAT